MCVASRNLLPADLDLAEVRLARFSQHVCLIFSIDMFSLSDVPYAGQRVFKLAPAAPDAPTFQDFEGIWVACTERAHAHLLPAGLDLAGLQLLAIVRLVLLGVHVGGAHRLGRRAQRARNAVDPHLREHHALRQGHDSFVITFRAPGLGQGQSFRILINPMPCGELCRKTVRVLHQCCMMCTK